ncbi:MAG: DUF1800 domain-containing protein [Acetobacteraceae bacterium]|nr:DUF1800 domain-containing protein [Acetobacteraceae bacterium]
MSRLAAVAAIRFGLGPRPGECAEIAHDPKGWVLAQLERVPPPLPAVGASVPTAEQGLATLLETQRNRPPPGAPNPLTVAYQDSMLALSAHWATTESPVIERFALLWSNHLTVSRRAASLAALVADHHLRAIRPHVLGPFHELLRAAVLHPAMLRYLDNHVSVGPNSEAGLRRRRGLNENLAREVLELHTVTPAAGYTQADVTQLAAALTGWGTGEAGESPVVFRPRAHEPGEKTILGRTFPEGAEGTLAALVMLATHPATFRALALRLARHYLADDPPPAVVAAVERRLAETEGDLGAAMRALVAHPLAWEAPLGKLRSPAEFVIASLRATGDPLPPPARLAAFGELGQPLFTAPSPKGWPDEAAAWSAPELILRRIDWAARLAARLPDPPDPRELLDAVLGPLADAETRAAVRGAPSVREGVLLVLASPAFQRR